MNTFKQEARRCDSYWGASTLARVTACEATASQFSWSKKPRGERREFAADLDGRAQTPAQIVSQQLCVRLQKFSWRAPRVKPRLPERNSALTN
jgi:hypothetical protein